MQAISKEDALRRYPDVDFRGDKFFIHKTAIIDNGVIIYNNVHIDANVRIHNRVTIHSCTKIKKHVTIGAYATICKHVVIKRGAMISTQVFIHENIVIAQHAVIHTAASIGGLTGRACKDVSQNMSIIGKTGNITIYKGKAKRIFVSHMGECETIEEFKKFIHSHLIQEEYNILWEATINFLEQIASTWAEDSTNSINTTRKNKL